MSLLVNKTESNRPTAAMKTICSNNALMKTITEKSFNDELIIHRIR